MKHLPKQGAVLAQLNPRWRVTFDKAQYILEYREGAQRPGRGSGHQQRSFCVQPTTLLARIGEYCGPVEPSALHIIEALPEHPSVTALRRLLRGTGA